MTFAAAPPANAAPPTALGAPRFGLWVLILGAVLISFSGIFVKISELGPTATGFHRLFLALPIFWLWMAGEARKNPERSPLRLQDWWLLTLCGLFFAGDLVFWHWSLHMTSVANATLLGNSTPIFVTLAGWLLFGKRFSLLFLLGLALAIGGTAVLVGVSLGHGQRPFLGDLLGVIVGAFYAGYIMLVGRLRDRFSTATVMGISGIASCLALLAVALASGESLTAHTLLGWAILLALAWLSQVAGQSAIVWSLAHLPAAFGAVTLLINPVAAAFLAWATLGERIGPLQAVGGVVVLIGIVLARQGSVASRQGGRVQTAGI
jgi:drug/metabolite transporter (DMT)-like permease